MMKQNMSNFFKIKTIREIISESPKLSEILSNYQLYLAHTPNESLEEHLNLTLSYLSILSEVNKLDSIIDNLIFNILPDESYIKVQEWIKKMFVLSFLFHDLGKVNVNFQAKKVKNELFNEIDSSYGSKHSLLSSYFYILYSTNNVLENFHDNNSISVCIGFSLLYSYSISNHHNSKYYIDFSSNEFESYLKIFSEYLKNIRFLYKQDICDKFFKTPQDANHISPFLLNLQKCVKYIRKKNNNEFCLWVLLKLQYSLLTAADYYATNHYKSKLKEFYNSDDFGIINNSLRNKMKENFIKIEYNKSLLCNTDSYLKYPLHNLQKSSFENLCMLRQKLGAEVYSNIDKYKNERIFYIEAPTGGGKTNLSMIAILKLLELYPDEITKIFYVFPFTTLITQTFRVLKDTFNLSNEDIIQIHSKAGFQTKNEDEIDYINTKNFIDYQFVNYPITLMSHIKFFDVLKSNEKETNYLLHRIANSVVIIDELQSYSPSEWDKLKYFISNFSEIFNIRFILMSATLPKIHNISVGENKEFCQLIENAQENYFQNPNFKDRVICDFSLYDKYGLITIDSLAKEVLIKSKEYFQRYGGVHTVVELIYKKSTTELYDSIDKLRDIFEFDEIFILSGTILEPRRKEVINYIKNPKHKNILLITTQVVEAGVDIDMDLGFKNVSLLDSDEQLAGRINRNAKKEKTILYLFKKDEPFRVYKSDIRFEFSKELYTEPNNRKEILTNKNFNYLYDLVMEYIDQHNSNEFIDNFYNYKAYINNLNFDKANSQFKLIDNDTASFFVPLNLKINSDIIGDQLSISKTELKFLQENNCLYQNSEISGTLVWNKYISIIKNFRDDFIANSINVKILSGIMSNFIFSIYEDKKLIDNLKPYLEYDELNKSYLNYGFYCFNSYYNQIYDFNNGLNENMLSESSFMY
jgi:CRISPR-associated endonuclease/helicase Cas3